MPNAAASNAPYLQARARAQDLRPVHRAEEHRARRPPRRNGDVPRAVRLRQDDAAAHHRRTRDAGYRDDRPGRSGHLAAAADEARLRHRVPVVCAVPQPDDFRQRRVRAGQPAQGSRRDPSPRRRIAQAGGLAGVGGEISRPAFRRPAATHRAGASAGDFTRAAVARRTAVRPRCAGTPPVARRNPRAATPPRRHDHHGHARPGRGAVDGGSRRRDEPGRDRADRHAAADLPRARVGLRRRFRRQDQRHQRGRGRRRPVPRRHAGAQRRARRCAGDAGHPGPTLPAAGGCRRERRGVGDGECRACAR